jgi:hypothetical protein
MEWFASVRVKKDFRAGVATEMSGARKNFLYRITYHVRRESLSGSRTIMSGSGRAGERRTGG